MKAVETCKGQCLSNCKYNAGIYIYILTLHVHTPSMWTILHYPFAVPATCPSKGVVLESTLLLPWRFASNFRQEVNPEKPNRECGVKDY